jgi:hypothetical protein
MSGLADGHDGGIVEKGRTHCETNDELWAGIVMAKRRPSVAVTPYPDDRSIGSFRKELLEKFFFKFNLILTNITAARLGRKIVFSKCDIFDFEYAVSVGAILLQTDVMKLFLIVK